MKKTSLIARLASIAVTACMLFTNQPWTIAAANEKQLDEMADTYVKEVRMFYADSLEKAKEYCAAEGSEWHLCPEDLNEGVDNDVHIYLGYTTTEDPGDAITDLTLLDMKNSYFEEMTYLEYLDKHIDEYADQAASIMVLVNEFRKQYKAGSPNAKAAYDSLNLFYMEEYVPLKGYNVLDVISNRKNTSKNKNDETLGDYLLNEADAAFFQKFLQRGNGQILSAIISILAGAASDWNNPEGTWVDRAKKSIITDLYLKGNSVTRNQYNGWYYDPAITFIDKIQEFSDTYNKAKELYDQYGDTFGYAESTGLSPDSTLEELMAADPNCRIPEYVGAFETYALLDSIVYQEAGESVITDAIHFYEDTDEDNEGSEGQEEDEDAEILYEEYVEEEEVNPEEYTIVYTERKTLAQYFLELAADTSLKAHPETVYPFIEGLTPAQRIALEKCGLKRIVMNLYQAEDYDSKREESIKEAKQKIMDCGFADGRLWVWGGTDQSLYEKKVAQTNDKIEAEKAGKVLINATNEAARKANSDWALALQYIDIGMTSVSAIAMIVQAIIGCSLWACGSALISVGSAAVAMGAAALGTLYVIGGVLLCSLYVLNILVLVASICYMVYMIMDACGCFDEPDIADYDSIPDILFHVRTNSFGNYNVRYDVVESSFRRYFTDLMEDWTNQKTRNTIGMMNSCFALYNALFEENDYDIDDPNEMFPADMSGYRGYYDRWMVLYATKSPAAGEPIQVVAGGSFLKTQVNNYQKPEGYKSVRLINGADAADINSIDCDVDTDTALYLFYAGNSDEADTGTVTDATQFINSVRLVHNDKQNLAVAELKKDGYTIIDRNITPYDDYTYIGYKLGSVEGALTDLRFSNSGLEQITFGDASYAKMGIGASGCTPDGMALYATASPAAGSPIVSITLMDELQELGCGLEPACTFSGGQAVNLAQDLAKSAQKENPEVMEALTKNTKNHPLTQQADLSDGLYLYFTPKVQFKSDNPDAKQYVAGFSYFFAIYDGNTKKPYFDSHVEYIKEVAKKSAFELVTDEKGAPAEMMTYDPACVSAMYHWKDKEGGLIKDWTYDIYHSVQKGLFTNKSDGAMGDVMGDTLSESRVFERSEQNGTMFFGVSYTYNPYRAITGVAGAITPYTERTASLKYLGLDTPAGAMRICTVNIMGCPIENAGICMSYYNMANMDMPWYLDSDTKQKHNLPWLTDQETEVLTHSLLMAGPATGRDPIAKDEIMFVCKENPGQYRDYVPLTDIRTPGDYEHPLNLALETTNQGSKYLYLYLRNDAGGRTDEQNSLSSVHTKKHYVAGVFCGVGDTVDEALNNLMSNAKSQWATIASRYPDISDKPLVTELDEIYPIELADEKPWYTLHKNSISGGLSDNKWAYSNEAAYFRWAHKDEQFGEKSPDDKENTHKCAYLGVVRTNYSITSEEAVVKKTSPINPVYSIMKYYTSKDVAPSTLKVGDTVCTLAGGPVKSKEGSYFIYYSTNEGTASFCAPVTEIDISSEQFINGFNTSFSCKESDRKNGALPSYDQLHMRTDEYLYFHTKYDMEDLPYIEYLYLGVGKTKAEAYADLVGTTNANAASTVNCNYNSYSDQWIAFGYRRTAVLADAICDVFLYYGDNPPDTFNCAPSYKGSSQKKEGKTVIKYAGYTYKDYKKDANGKTVKDEKGSPITVTYTGAPYTLVQHNLPDGTIEPVSLNAGNSKTNGFGLYMYICHASNLFYDMEKSAQLYPIKNIAFCYGDISPEYASAEDLASVYISSMYGMKEFKASTYERVSWEHVLGIEADSPTEYKIDGSNAFPVSLNHGILPRSGNDIQHADGNRRISMYVDRGYFKQIGDKTETIFKPRPNAALDGTGYYSSTTDYGVLTQAN